MPRYCMHDILWCDKQVDCDDGSDEASCQYAACPAGYTECATGYVVFSYEHYIAPLH